MRLLTKNRIVEIKSFEIMSWGLMYKFNDSIYKIRMTEYNRDNVISDLLKNGYADVDWFQEDEEYLG